MDIHFGKSIKKRGNFSKSEFRGISEKFEEIAEMHQKMSNLIGFRLFLIRFRVEAFPCHHYRRIGYLSLQKKKLFNQILYRWLRLLYKKKLKCALNVKNIINLNLKIGKNHILLLKWGYLNFKSIGLMKSKTIMIYQELRPRYFQGE